MVDHRVTRPGCRSCDHPLDHVFADLGTSPLANAYVPPEALFGPETFHPLTAYVCGNCLLVQLVDHVTPDTLFGDYAYFSSYSDSWLEHCRRYSEAVVRRFQLRPSSLVLELASNDGYMLRHFQDAGIPVLGVEPAANVARVAEEKGIPTHVEFWDRHLARRFADEGRLADLLVANNVLAHVPDPGGFLKGVEIVLAPGGVATFEFPSLLRLIEQGAFDTIYHEHFSYFSFLAAHRIFERQGLTIFDVQELPTHGGSLRIFARRAGDPGEPVSDAVGELLERERLAGLADPATYTGFHQQILKVKRAFLRSLIDLKEEGRSIVGYGAPAKGNTLLNFCGIGRDFLEYTVDRSPHKQGMYLPGTRIPIHPPEQIAETKPDLVLILPWNLRDEIVGQMGHIREWGGRFIVPIPKVEIVD